MTMFFQNKISAILGLNVIWNIKLSLNCVISLLKCKTYIDCGMNVVQMMDEEAKIEAEVAEVQTWWNSERFRLTQRPYIAKYVVRLRGTMRQSYASNELAKRNTMKKWNEEVSPHVEPATKIGVLKLATMPPATVLLSRCHHRPYVRQRVCSKTPAELCEGYPGRSVGSQV